MIAQLTIAIVLLLIVLAAKVIGDYKLWLKERHINHKKERWRWWLIVLGCAPSITLFTLSSDFFWYIAAPISAAMCALFIWLMFDAIYNKLRGFGVWYTGTDDEGDAAPDNFLQAMPLAIHILIKTVPLGLLIYFYIKGL